MATGSTKCSSICNPHLKVATVSAAAGAKPLGPRLRSSPKCLLERQGVGRDTSHATRVEWAFGPGVAPNRRPEEGLTHAQSAATGRSPCCLGRLRGVP